MKNTQHPFSAQLQDKISWYKEKIPAINLNGVSFSSPLLLAPMAGICHSPFRRLMEDLGAGGTVSELISSHGINYGNQKTLDMLRIDPAEKHVGIQLFGENAESLAKSIKIVETYHPQFIDLNLGCPVRKVVTKGAGSALLGNPQHLSTILKAMKEATQLPITIKIRTGLDEHSKNAPEIIELARDCGVSFVAIHGRTKAQQYRGQADWEYLKNISKNSPLPIIGNGDLHTPQRVHEEMQNQSCPAYMLGRGPLRLPFIFLESFAPTQRMFSAQDHWELALKLFDYMKDYYPHEQRTLLVQFRKHVVWFASGMPNSAKFRGHIFSTQSMEEVLELGSSYFNSFDDDYRPELDHDAFMTSGHG